MDAQFLGVPLIVWGCGCLIAAGIFAVAWPKRIARGVEGPRYVILRWGHTAVWLFLALSCFIRAVGVGEVADVVAFLALPAYLLFLTAISGNWGKRARD